MKSARRTPTLALLAVTLLGQAVLAQRTWIVDASNGAGTDFTDLPAAFMAVSDGDRVDVRQGRYSPARLDKAIRLVADASAIVTIGKVDFVITGIAAGRICAVHGLQFDAGSGLTNLSSVRVLDNKGMVVLSGLRIELRGPVLGLWIQRTHAGTWTCARMIRSTGRRSTDSQLDGVFKAMSVRRAFSPSSGPETSVPGSAPRPGSHSTVVTWHGSTTLRRGTHRAGL